MYAEEDYEELKQLEEDKAEVMGIKLNSGYWQDVKESKSVGGLSLSPMEAIDHIIRETRNIEECQKAKLTLPIDIWQGALRELKAIGSLGGESIWTKYPDLILATEACMKFKSNAEVYYLSEESGLSRPYIASNYFYQEKTNYGEILVGVGRLYNVSYKPSENRLWLYPAKVMVYRSVPEQPEQAVDVNDDRVTFH